MALAWYAVTEWVDVRGGRWVLDHYDLETLSDALRWARERRKMFPEMVLRVARWAPDPKFKPRQLGRLPRCSRTVRRP